MTEQNQPFSQPTRQSSAAILFILGGVLRMLFRQLWVVILVFVFNRKTTSFDGYTLFFLGLAAFTALISLINYFNLFFYIRNGELVLEKGALRKSKLNVPLDRVQTVNFRQNIVHQIFNVVAVDIDTAGSAGKEFSLHALSKPQAELLRETVGNWQRAGKVPPSENVGAELEGATALAESTSPKSEILFRLRPLDLVKIGVSQNHLRTAGILFAFFFSFADDVGQALNINLEKRMQWWLFTNTEGQIVLALLMAVPFFLTISFLFTLVRTVLQYYDLHFWRTERGFRIVSGLFTRQEVSAVLTKIQYVLWSSSPLKRWFGMVQVRLPQAASVVVSGKLAVGLPGCYAPQLTAVRAAYFPEETQQNWEPHGVDARIVGWQFLKWGPLPALILMNITWQMVSAEAAFIWLAWLPVAWWLAGRYHQAWRWEVSDAGLRAEWGALNRTAVLLQWHKVQAVSLRRSFLSQRSKLARLTFYTAAGAVSIPFVPLAKAQAVQDFVLYRVETNDAPWM